MELEASAYLAKDSNSSSLLLTQPKLPRGCKLSRKGTWLLVLLAVVLLQSFILSIQVADALKVAKVYVNPATVTKGVGESFTVEIRVVDAEDLFTYAFKVKWRGTSMNATKIEEGDFLSGGGVFETLFIPHIFNGPDGSGVEADYVVIGNTLMGDVQGVFGDGILATVTFQVESLEVTAIDLFRVELIDSRGYDIILGVGDGYLNIQPPKLSVDPSAVINETMVVGDSFTVNVTISNVVDLLGLRFNMTYDTGILNATQVSIPPFLTEPVIPWEAEATWAIIRTHGTVRVDIYSSADPPVPVSVPISVNATVAEVTFQVVGASPKGGKDGKGGTSVLYIYHCEVDDSIARTVKNHTPPAQNGYFDNTAKKHDINVRRIVASPVKVNKGDTVFMNITVKNAGGFEETFNLTVYYATSVESNIVDNRSNIAIQIGKETIQQFEWNTTQVKAGKYTLKAVASLAQDDNLLNNERIYETLITVEETSSTIDPMILYAIAGVVAVVIIGVIVWRLRKKP